VKIILSWFWGLAPVAFVATASNRAMFRANQLHSPTIKIACRKAGNVIGTRDLPCVSIWYRV